MIIALFGNSIPDPYLGYLQQLVDNLSQAGDQLMLYKPFAVSLEGRIRFDRQPLIFSVPEEIVGKTGLFLSIGGDGTILEAVTIVRDSGIPIAGINMGHLGFLSSISKEEILPAITEIREKKYFLDQRTLLKLESTKELFPSCNFALNDVTVYKGHTPNLLSIKTYIDGEFLNGYWADGLIVATPTGSTAYSLSCTGPILTPDAENFVITPIASHNLTVRPIVVRDTCRISIVIDSKEKDFFVSLDSRMERITEPLKIDVFKAPFRVGLIRLSGSSFYKTIREKLKWGLDIRN